MGRSAKPRPSIISSGTVVLLFSLVNTARTGYIFKPSIAQFYKSNLLLVALQPVQHTAPLSLDPQIRYGITTTKNFLIGKWK